MYRMAARDGDIVLCLKHGAGTCKPVDRKVLVNGKNAVGTGDPVECMPTPVNPNLHGPYDVPNKMMAGAAEVWLGGTPMSGMLHGTMHNSGGPTAPNGFVIFGSFDVFIGGDTLVGDVAAAKAACEAAKASRGGGNQHANNCGVEQVRTIANSGSDPNDPGYVGEDQALCDQVAAGNAQIDPSPSDNAKIQSQCQKYADQARTTPGEEGDALSKQFNQCKCQILGDSCRKNAAQRKGAGTGGPDDRQRALDGYGQPSTQQPNNLNTVGNGVANGQGVITPVQNFPTNEGTVPEHIVTATGVVYDDQGNPQTVYYNDSMGDCGAFMPADEFKNHQQSGGKANVTNKPVW
jgi:hypothetical protein